MEGRYFKAYTRADAESHLLKKGFELGDYVIRDATKANGKYVATL